MLGHCLLAPCVSLSLGAAANLPRLRIFYTFYMFYTAITTPLPTPTIFLRLLIFGRNYGIIFYNLKEVLHENENL